MEKGIIWHTRDMEICNGMRCTTILQLPPLHLSDNLLKVVRVTLPAHAPTIPPAYSSLYHDTGDQWHDHDHEEVEAVEEHSKNFNTNLYDVVTDDNEGDNLAEEEAQEDVVVEDEDAAYENRLEELQRKYGSKMSAVDSEDFRFSATHEHPHNYPHNKGRMEDPLIMLMKVNNSLTSTNPEMFQSLF